MAFATKVTLGIGYKLTHSPEAQDVSVRIAYELERTDSNLLAFITEKAVEVEDCLTQLTLSITAKRAEEESAERLADAHTVSKDQQAPPNRSRKGKEIKGEERTILPPSQTTPAPKPALSTAEPNETPRNRMEAYEPAMNAQKIALRTLAGRKGYTPESLANLLQELYGKASVDDLTKDEAKEMLIALQKGELDQTGQAA